jgi:hypothetical protein
VGTGAKVVIRGNNFDARPFLRAATQGAPTRQEADKDVDLDIRTTLLSGHGGEVMTNAEARIVRRGGQLRQISVTGKLNGRAVTLAGRSAGENPPAVNIDSDDAGALLRYIDIYTRMVGGDLNGQLTPGAKNMSGFIIARDFALRNEPAIRRLVSESTGSTSSPGQVLSNDVGFTKMRVDFSREGDQINVRDAVIFGPQLGLTFNGLVNQPRDRISLSGTYIPAYGLNNAFSQIPLFGAILGGGRNEGLLAITFGVSGRAANPNITVNPLSAVAPGIFRKIFEFRNDRTGSTPQLSPAQQN